MASRGCEGIVRAAIPGAATLLWLALWLVGCATGLSAHGEPGATGMWAHDDPDAVTLDSWGQEAAVEGPLVVLTDPGELPSLKLAGSAETVLPLEHTAVRAVLNGFVAEVEVKQTYANPHPEAIEVVYVFPLPENAAVNHMEMHVGARVVQAEIQERNRARRIYQQAKSQGFTAALLEQERPNVFTQSVANIEPGKPIDIVVRYVQDLTYDAGEYEFVFPMVVGPRFIPGSPTGAPPSGTGTHPDTDEVPDASRIRPPYRGEGQRSGHDISIELLVNGPELQKLRVPTHEVVLEQKDGAAVVKLASHDSLPNRDFVMRYQVAGPRPRATLLTSTDAGSGYFSLVIHPPELPVRNLVGEREIIFVVDVSGSMYGEPLALCKEAMRTAIGRLQAVDTFNILTFAGATGKAFPEPRPVNRHSIDEALQVVDELKAGGGTYMLDAVKEALQGEVAPGRHRYVFFLTDGEVGNEAAIHDGAEQLVERLKARGQRARVFGFGVGSSPNRHLLDGLARAGKGLTVYASGREDPALAVDRFFRYIDRSVVRDIELDWDARSDEETYPARIPELFASHPIIVHGRYRQPPQGDLVVRGKVGDRTVEIPVRIERSRGLSDEGRVLGSLWARAKITELERHLWRGDPQAQARITELGIEHRLLTPFTSFVAVDRSQRVSNGNPRTIVQPAEMPEGVDPVMSGARASGGGAVATSPGSPAIDFDSRHANDEASEDLDNFTVYSAPPAAEHSARGCYCDAGAAGDGGAAPRWLALVGIALALWRRRSATPPGAGPAGIRHGHRSRGSLCLERRFELAEHDHHGRKQNRVVAGDSRGARRVRPGSG